MLDLHFVGYYFVELLLNDNEYLMVYTITIDVKLLESSCETNEMIVTRCHLYQQVGAVEKVKLYSGTAMSCTILVGAHCINFRHTSLRTSVLNLSGKSLGLVSSSV